MSSHVVSISSISFVCHLNAPEAFFFSSSFTKSSLITEVPRKYVGRCRGGGIPGIKVVWHSVCVCVYTHPWGLSMFCCPAFLSNELLYEANICGRWFLSHVQTRPSFPHFSIFLFLHSYYKSAIWYWGQLCQTSAPHRSSKENNPSNAPWRKLACVTMMSALGGCFFSAAT